jgi:hypothetical protein
MKRFLIILITLVVFGLITLAGLEWMARIENKHSNTIQFSNSAEISKKNKFFVSNYHALADTVHLTQHPGILHFNTVFAEHGWRLDTSTFYLLSKKIPAEVYNIIINYSQTPEVKDVNIDLEPLNDSIENAGMIHYGNNMMIHRTATLQDTVWFRLLEKTNDSAQSWMESEKEIGFIRKN